MADAEMHLIERAAERLRAEGGLADSAPPALAPRRPTQPGEDAVGVAAQSVAASSGNAESVLVESMAEQSDALGASDTVLPERGAAPALAAAASVAPVLLMPPGQVQPVDPPGEGAGKFLEIAQLERGGLVVGRKSRTRISEEFRIAVGHVLRNLQSSYTAGHGSANLIMVTSSRPGEGKSFTAMNLAGCIAQQNQREVLLVDIDAKQRPVTFELGLGDAPGLLDLVRDPTLRIEDVIVPTAIPSLSFIPIGARMASNAEMPLSRPISAMVERLGRRFANRVIILDAPPCLSTSDPSALAPTVGQVLMVVEAERTQRNELVAALELVRVCPTITLLLNKIQLTTSYTFGAYHYFGTYS